MNENSDNFDPELEVNIFAEFQNDIQNSPEPSSPLYNPTIEQRPINFQSQPIPVVKQKTIKKLPNKFCLSDEQKINISKRLTKGFVLLKRGDFPDNNHQGPFKGEIQYVPIAKPPKIASQQLLEKFPLALFSNINSKRQPQKMRADKPGLRLSSGQLPQGKSKQTQKVKGVLQKLRKHQKFPILYQQLSKLGLSQGLNQIQSQIKKNIHTIDSFKDRLLYILNQCKQCTSSQATLQVIGQLIEQLMFQIEQAKKLQFQNNLILIQKNIDKITREITDIRQSGNWYLRRKKRTEKSYDQKEIMYITDLIRELPPPYLLGVWEIIEEKPFLESSLKDLEINFCQLKTKKIREIQSYVKRKHNTIFKSRQRKQQKMRLKRGQSQHQQQKKYEQKKQKSLKQQQAQNDLQNFFQIQQFQKKPFSQRNLSLHDQQLSGIDNQKDQRHLRLDDQFLGFDQMFPQDKENQQYAFQQKPKVQKKNQQQDKQLEFEQEGPNLRLPQQYNDESSDSSMITDDQDSDY